MTTKNSKFPDKDPYHVLGVAPSASHAEISKAYRKLALQLHPDKQQGLSAADLEENAHKFQDIQTARSFLLDTEHQTARQEYDRKRASDQMRKQADAAREKGLSERRKRMRDELNRQEAVATTKSMRTSSQKKTNSVVEELRRQGTKLREDLADRAAEKASKQAFEQAADKNQQLEDRQVRLKWSRKKLKTSPSEHSLAQIFARFGTVERVEMLGSKGNAALVTFSNADSCRPCVDSYIDSNEMRANFVGKRKDREEEEATARAEAEVKASRLSKEKPHTSGSDWKLRRAAERERLLREMEERERGGSQNVSAQPERTKKRKASHGPFPPPFSSPDGVDGNLSPLEKLEQVEARLLKDLLPTEKLQRIRLSN